MPMRHPMRLIAAALAAVLILSGCQGGGSAPVVVGEAQRGGAATVAEVNAFTSFNPFSADGNTDINSKIGAVTHSGFHFLDQTARVVRNDKFGSYEKISDQPLKVRYTVNEGVKWSDGEAIDAGDLLLSWAAGSGYFDDEDTALGTGTKYFDSAADTSGLAGTVFPELGDDGRSITLEYTQPYADWEVAFDVGLPAHVVAAKGGLSDEDALIKLLEDSPRANPEKPAVNADLKKVADFWNSGFNATAIPDDPSLYLSSGPFIVQDIVPGVSMKLVRNRDYVWGQEPRLDEINVRFTASFSAAVDALRNGQVDILAPQPSAGNEAVFAGLAAQGVAVERYSQSGYDHLDLNFAGAFAARDVREAFLKTVPRQAIVDAVVGDLLPDSKPLDSHVFLPAQPKYGDAAKDNGSGSYAEVDIDGAKELLAGKTPTIRILYNRDNPNRAESFALIRDSAKRAGFTVVDAGEGNADWARSLGSSSHDATLLGWIGTGAGVSRVPQIFRTGAGSNYNGFSDDAADKAMAELSGTTDLGKQDDLLVVVDKRLWESAYGLPLYQTVGATAVGARIAGVKSSAGPLGVWWNVWEWRLA